MRSTRTATRGPRNAAGIDRYFKISERGSTVAREIRGGVVTFFTMAYIVVLNPLILGAGVDGDGGKLSKSGGAVSLRSMRARLQGPGPLLAFFARRLGLNCAHPSAASDLLMGFDPDRIPASALAWADLLRDTGME